MSGLEIRIDARDVIEGADKFTRAIEIANTSAVARIRTEIAGIVRDALEVAFEESGLPYIYQQHLRRVIHGIYPDVAATSDGIVAYAYSMEELGSEELLQEGYHYHAILDIEDKKDFSVSSPPRVELPYSGEELYNDFEKRYQFWLAIIVGGTYEVEFGGGLTKTGRRTPRHTKTIDTTGMYEETLRARVRFWGLSAPEWLLLEYGQEYEPETPPTHVREIMEQRIEEYMRDVYEEILDSVIDVWESPEISVNSAGRLFEKGSGRFAKYLPD